MCGVFQLKDRFTMDLHLSNEAGTILRQPPSVSKKFEDDDGGPQFFLKVPIAFSARHRFLLRAIVYVSLSHQHLDGIRSTRGTSAPRGLIPWYFSAV